MAQTPPRPQSRRPWDRPSLLFVVLSMSLAAAVLVNLLEFNQANQVAERRYQALNQEKSLGPQRLVRESGANKGRFVRSLAMAQHAPEAELVLPRSAKGLLGEYLLFGRIAAHRFADYDPDQVFPDLKLDRHVLKRVKARQHRYLRRDLRIIAKATNRRNGLRVARGRELIFVRRPGVDAFVDSALLSQGMEQLGL